MKFDQNFFLSLQNHLIESIGDCYFDWLVIFLRNRLRNDVRSYFTTVYSCNEINQSLRWKSLGIVDKFIVVSSSQYNSWFLSDVYIEKIS